MQPIDGVTISILADNLFDGLLPDQGPAKRSMFGPSTPRISAPLMEGGEWEWDPLILDGQAILLHVREKGLVILTGCGHAGIVNIVRYARKLTDIEQIYAILVHEG